MYNPWNTKGNQASNLRAGGSNPSGRTTTEDIDSLKAAPSLGGGIATECGPSDFAAVAVECGLILAGAIEGSTSEIATGHPEIDPRNDANDILVNITKGGSEAFVELIFRVSYGVCLDEDRDGREFYAFDSHEVRLESITGHNLWGAHQTVVPSAAFASIVEALNCNSEADVGLAFDLAREFELADEAAQEFWEHDTAKRGAF